MSKSKNTINFLEAFSFAPVEAKPTEPKKDNKPTHYCIFPSSYTTNKGVEKKVVALVCYPANTGKFYSALAQVCGRPSYAKAIDGMNALVMNATYENVHAMVEWATTFMSAKHIEPMTIDDLKKKYADDIAKAAAIRKENEKIAAEKSKQAYAYLESMGL